MLSFQQHRLVFHQSASDPRWALWLPQLSDKNLWGPQPGSMSWMNKCRRFGQLCWRSNYLTSDANIKPPWNSCVHPQKTLYVCSPCVLNRTTCYTWMTISSFTTARHFRDATSTSGHTLKCFHVKSKTRILCSLVVNTQLEPTAG